MANSKHLFEVAFHSWSQWCGLCDQGEIQTLKKKVEAEFQKEMIEIGAALCQPPSENLTQTDEDFTQASADILMDQVAKKIGIRPIPFWPKNAPYVVSVTHDIDRIFATYHRARGITTQPFATLPRIVHDVTTRLIPSLWEKNPFYNLKRMQSFEGSLGVKSASYVLFEKRRLFFAAKRKEIQHFLGVYSPQTIMKELKEYEDDGNEVGIHGSFDSWNDGSALKKEVSQLKSGGIKKIKGVRNHYLQYDSLKTPQAQQEAQIEYDSTCGFNFLSGFRSKTCFPFQVNPILELPFNLMDTTLRYQFGTFAERQSCARIILEEVRARRGMLILNWHTQIMNSEYFQEPVDLLADLIQIAKKDGAWIALPREISDWWLNQRKRGIQIYF